MRWLHLSDLHYNPKEDGRSSEQLRRNLPIFLCKKRISVDDVFITGDYRHALYQDDTDVIASNSAAFILEIAESVGVKDRKHIHLVPGNHDLVRSEIDKDKIELLRIRSNYDYKSGIISKSDVKFLLGRFSFYNRVVEKLNIDNLKLDFEHYKLHSFYCGESYSILYLNTAIMCGADDRGMLVLGNNDLYQMLEEIVNENPNVPIIALGHHGIYNFTQEERKAIESIFSEFNVAIYLCGDDHETWCRTIGHNTIEITTGCLKYEEGAQIVFSVGEIDPNGSVKEITAYNWDSMFCKWDEYSHFNSHISKMIKNLHPITDEEREFLPDEIEPKNVTVPNSLLEKQMIQYDCSSLLLMVFFVNSWDENNENDKNIVADLLSVSSFSEINDEIRKLVSIQNSPLSYKKTRFERNYSFSLEDPLAVWKTIAHQIFKEDIDIYKNAFVKVYKAGKHEYSSNIRKGLATSLAIIANNQEDVINLERFDRESFITDCLYSVCPWDEEMKWESLDDVIKLYAEACPSFFLNKLEKSLDEDSTELSEIVNNYSLLSMGNTVYIIINILKMLAIEAQYLDKCIALLGKLYSKYSEFDKNNEIISAMANIYFPWFPRTMASLNEQITSIRMLYKEAPEACCKMLLQLMSDQITCSGSGNRTSWRKEVPEEWYDRKISQVDCRNTHKIICELLLEYGSGNFDVILDITKSVDNFIPFDNVIKFLMYEMSFLEEIEKLNIWHILDEIVAKHKYFYSEDWAMTKEQIDQLTIVKDLYNPNDLIEINLRLFDHDAYEGVYYDEVPLSERNKKLNKKRVIVIKQILKMQGIIGVENLIVKAKNVHFVGDAIVDANYEISNKDIKSMLVNENVAIKNFILYYINHKTKTMGIDWAKTVNMSTWDDEEKTEYFLAMPLANTFWLWAENELKTYSYKYWSKIWNPCFMDEYAHDYAIERLLDCENVNAAIICLCSDIKNGKTPDTCLVLKALGMVSTIARIDSFYISDLVKHLQSIKDMDFETLAGLEYKFYEMLNYDVTPKTLNKKIASQPDYFIELVRRRYRLFPYDKKQDDEWNKVWNIVNDWAIVPGTEENGFFNEEKFTSWIHNVQEKAKIEKISEYVDSQIGGVLIYSLKDGNGIPIEPIASFLEKNIKSLNGFSTKLFNSRGVHNCSSKEELELAEKYKALKDYSKVAGYRRLSEIYANFEENHRKEAERYAAESK